jgi:hypothetical protein
MTIDKQRYLDVAKQRYTEQFKNKENFGKLVETWVGESLELQDVISDIDDIKYIDKASGKQLDNIGDIVGQPRLLIDADLIAFFGFQGISISKSFGDLNDVSAGGRWKSLGEYSTGNILLSDNEYRLFIRAKIIRNTTVATTEDVIDSIKFLFQADKVHLIEGEYPASYRVAVGSVLTQQQKNLIKYDYQDGVKRNLVVKPAGVRIDSFSEFNPDQFFGFQGVQGSSGYGDLLEIAEYIPYYQTFGLFGFDGGEYAQPYGDVNNPSAGSRWKSLGESSDVNNIVYEGPLKKFQYKDPTVTSISIGGYYSSIVN